MVKIININIWLMFHDFWKYHYHQCIKPKHREFSENVYVMIFHFVVRCSHMHEKWIYAIPRTAIDITSGRTKHS